MENIHLKENLNEKEQVYLEIQKIKNRNIIQNETYYQRIERQKQDILQVHLTTRL